MFCALSISYKIHFVKYKMVRFYADFCVLNSPGNSVLVVFRKKTHLPRSGLIQSYWVDFLPILPYIYHIPARGFYISLATNH